MEHIPAAAAAAGRHCYDQLVFTVGMKVAFCSLCFRMLQFMSKSVLRNGTVTQEGIPI
jgi:hypothetical protein